MKKFEDYNPAAVFLYFLAVTVPGMFCMDPLLLLLSFAGALALHLSLTGWTELKSILWIFALPVLGFLLNPVFNHNGATVLLVVNDTPISLESALYGGVMGLMLGAVLLWFRSFSRIMTSDKLLYIMGSASPKLALIFSMTLRYIPLYKRQIRRINQSQKALGLYREDVLLDRLKGGMRIFSVMVTWALENGVITADSMTARGYGTGRRSQFAIFRWRREDVIFAVISLLFGALVLAAIGTKALGCEWYPRIAFPEASPLRITGLIIYALLCFGPTILNIREELLWKSLQSEI